MAEHSNTLKTAEQRVEDMGLPIPKAPGRHSDIIEWPDNVGTLTPDELAEHLTWWSGWAGHTRYQLARVETDLEAFETDHSWERQKRIFKSKGDYATVTELKASIDQMPDMAKKQARVLEAEAMKKLLRSLVASYEEKYATVSREISRRGQDREEGRAGNSDRYRA